MISWGRARGGQARPSDHQTSVLGLLTLTRPVFRFPDDITPKNNMILFLRFGLAFPRVILRNACRHEQLNPRLVFLCKTTRGVSFTLSCSLCSFRLREATNASPQVILLPLQGPCDSTTNTFETETI